MSIEGFQLKIHEGSKKIMTYTIALINNTPMRVVLTILEQQANGMKEANSACNYMLVGEIKTTFTVSNAPAGEH